MGDSEKVEEIFGNIERNVVSLQLKRTLILMIMSTEALSGLRDYLFVTLSRTNMLWLAEQLKERANRKEELKPYTVEELHHMVEDGKRQIAEGRSYSTEEVLAYCGHEELQFEAV